MPLPPVGRCILAWLLVLPLGSASRAQPAGPGSGAGPEAGALLQEPAAFRVYQRDRDGRADILVKLRPGLKDASVVSARLSGLPAGAGRKCDDGKFRDVATG